MKEDIELCSTVEECYRERRKNELCNLILCGGGGVVRGVCCREREGEEGGGVRACSGEKEGRILKDRRRSSTGERK